MFDGHEGQVWRVSWNVTGTVLSTSGADATVRLWRGAKMDVMKTFIHFQHAANYMGRWSCMSVVRPHEMQVAISPLSPQLEREPTQQRRDVFY